MANKYYLKQVCKHLLQTPLCQKIALIICLIGCYSIVYGSGNEKIALIPAPVKMVLKKGNFKLPEQVIVYAENSESIKHVAGYLQKRIAVPTGRKVQITSNAALKNIAVKLLINKTNNEVLGNEGYTLTVADKQITLTANTSAGLFYGVQTLLQLFPQEIERKTFANKTEWNIPCAEITDYPRFKWRGLMLDVSRHFFNKAEVKSYIDNMVKYKYNLLHLHLTDDQGWRIEIKSYPNLTKTGAWRVDKMGIFGEFSKPAKDEPKTYGGYFTQDDIKELVKYAAANFVNILPEIDVPGHSMAALAAYPNLSGTPGEYSVNSGENFVEWLPEGGFKLLTNNTISPAKEEVYVFLDSVFSEVSRLFPFKYIHAGGDECAKTFWEKNEDVRALMKKEGLKDMNDVQAFFMKRVNKIITSKGKKMIGWDEILDGGLPAEATVMNWRDRKKAIEATQLGHEVIIAPSDKYYLDMRQGDVAIEPEMYAVVRLKDAYEYEIVPDSVNSKLVLGGQGNLWTEQIYSIRQVEYMTWPRAFAIAESVWSPKQPKNWDNFSKRTIAHFGRLAMAETKYAPSIYDPIVKTHKDSNGRLLISLATELDGLDIYYSFDNAYPDRFYPKYTEQLKPPVDAKRIRLITYQGTKPVGRMMTISMEELNKRPISK